MTINNLCNELQNTYYNYFPESLCKATLTKNLYPSISIWCFLANNKEELSGGYWENDILSVRFTIDTTTGELDRSTTGETESPENLRIQADSKSYLTKPDNEYMCYGRKQLKFRKIIGDAQNIIKCFDKFCMHLKADITSTYIDNRIHDNHKSIVQIKVTQ